MKGKHFMMRFTYLFFLFALVSLVACNNDNTSTLEPIDDAFTILYAKDSTFTAVSNMDTIKISSTTLYNGDTAMKISFEVKNVLSQAILMQTAVQRYFISGATR